MTDVLLRGERERDAQPVHSKEERERERERESAAFWRNFRDDERH